MSLDGRGVWEGKDAFIQMAEWFCCPPETITSSIGYNPTENQKDLKRVSVFLDHWSAHTGKLWLALANLPCYFTLHI